MIRSSFTKSAAFAVLFGIASVPAMADELVIGIDNSDSVSITTSPHIAAQAADLVYTRIAGMKRGDTVKIRSLGFYGTAAQTIHMNVKLSRKARPHKVAQQVALFIRDLPKLVTKGRIGLQNETNIIGFIETVAPSLDCQKQPTTLLILSDGIEHSAYISGRDLVTGKKALPTPSEEILKGCTLEMRGLAQQRKQLSNDPHWFSRLHKQWAHFAKQAGVSRFLATAEYR